MAVVKQQHIILVSTDKELVQETKSAFAAFETTELVTIAKQVTELTTEVHLAEKSVVIIDMDTRRLDEIESLAAADAAHGSANDGDRRCARI